MIRVQGKKKKKGGKDLFKSLVACVHKCMCMSSCINACANFKQMSTNVFCNKI